jgi:type III secretory pathway component EscU
MINLYRGLMDIIINQNKKFESELITHIRSNSSVPDEYTHSMGFNNFWNFLLEVTMILFSKFIFVAAIFLITVLIVIFFPFYALTGVMTFAAREERYATQMVEPQMEVKQEVKTEEKK